MVEAVNGTVPVVSKKDNTLRNTAIGTGVGLVGGGATGYLTKNILKNGELTDEFVKEYAHTMIETQEKSLDAGKDVIKMVKECYDLGEDFSTSDARKFYKKYAKVAQIDDKTINAVLDQPDEKFIEAMKEFRSRILDAKNTGNKFKSYNVRLKEGLGHVKEWYTSNKNSLKADDAQIKELEAYKFATSAMKKLKFRAGAIWGASAAIVLGFGTFVISHIFSHKDA